MTEPTWRERAEALILSSQQDASRIEEVGALGLELVNERLDAEGLRGKIWAVFPYQCDSCAHEEWYEVEVGVEGPQEWRDDYTFIACAYVAGRCPSCNGTMTHVLHHDVILAGHGDPGEPFVATGITRMTFASKMFRVPREPVRYATEGCTDDGNVIYSTATHAFLSTPIHAIRRGPAGYFEDD